MKLKTIEMHRYNIQWSDVADEIGVTQQSIYNWRNGDERDKHKVIDMAIKTIVDTRQLKTNIGG